MYTRIDVSTSVACTHIPSSGSFAEYGVPAGYLPPSSFVTPWTRLCTLRMPLRRLVRLLGRAEDDLRGQVERPVEPPPGVLAVVRVLRHARADERMRDLQDEGGAPSEEENALPVHPPGDAVGAEQARVAHERDRIAASRVPSPQMTWGFIWMVVVLKIPIVALLWLVWWAVHAEPEPAAGDSTGGDGGSGHSPRPQQAAAAARGDHAVPAPQPPARVRALGRRSDSVRHG